MAKMDRETVEERLENMKNLYKQIDQIIDLIPDPVPQSVKDLLKNRIVRDKDLKELMDGLEKNRPPRLLLVGRTGVGKSSLINALTGCYTAQVSDTKSMTPETKPYECKNQGSTLMEILDTRGIAESEDVEGENAAEEELLDTMNGFEPDAALLLLNCTHRDSVDEDAEYLKRLVKKYYDLNRTKLPVIVVATKADDVQPAREKDPAQYPERKMANIEEIIRVFRSVLDKHGVEYQDIIAVSSYLEWRTPDGEDVIAEDINRMTDAEKGQLEIAFDGRYQIDALRVSLESAIEDAAAKMGLRMAMRLEEMVRSISKRLINIFSGIASAVALTPIPFSDIYILLILQAVLVMIIASLSGRKMDLNTAKEFVISMAGVGGAGFGFRLIAQQAAKFVNAVFPAAGSAVSSAIAYGGTKAIGEAAVAYYLQGVSMEDAKEIFARKKNNLEE